MRLLDTKGLLLWLLLAVLAALAIAWSYPRTYPYRPVEWRIDRADAVTLALERLRELGPLPENPYVVASLFNDRDLELRLTRSADSPAGFRSSRLSRALHYWTVHVYAPGAESREWSYQALIGLDGSVLGLLRGVAFDYESPAQLGRREARLRAGEFLEQSGLSLGDYHAPVDRTIERGRRTDLYLRYLDRERFLGDALQYGVEVRFAGDELTGFYFWTDDPEARELALPLRRSLLSQTFWTFVPFLLLPLAGLLFARRYHEGLVSVRRGVQIFFLVLGSLVTVLLLTGAANAENVSFGDLSRVQMTWVWVAIQSLIYVPAIALLGFIGWSLGESFCDAPWRARLAGFDAVFRGAFDNGTVASSAMRGVTLGLLLVALLLLGARTFALAGASPLSSDLFGLWWEQSALPGVTLLLERIGRVLPYALFGYLLLLPRAVGRLGPWLGAAAVALFVVLVFEPPLLVLPVAVTAPLWLLLAAALAGIFLRYDLLTMTMAALVVGVLTSALPLMAAVDPGLRVQGWLAVMLAATPLWASLRRLGSAESVDYAWDEVPPHVRRIAERERQRVEIETARQIQSSILPRLPDRLAGVELAYRYLPATEVGGDFYDVHELDEGRLSLAIGDVAGHGVSSGLVMSMARAALAVQVAFRPEVEAVFETLNRVIYDSAQKRLLTTLCYAVLDARSHELFYASAGHIYPYRVSTEGEVRALESTAYPLGVRERLRVEARRAKLAGGDSLFLSSDGLVEARREDNDEPFGFERLEESLARHSHRGAGGIASGVLDDLDHFLSVGTTGHEGAAEREDDLTILVLTLPRTADQA